MANEDGKFSGRSVRECRDWFYEGDNNGAICLGAGSEYHATIMRALQCLVLLTDATPDELTKWSNFAASEGMIYCADTLRALASILTNQGET